MIKRILSAIVILFLASACGSSDDSSSGNGADNFDRGAMLTNWADNIIIPSYTAYQNSLTSLQTSLTTFSTTSDQTNLDAVRSAWKDAYVAWQRVSMFEIGKADELKLRNWTNIYPANVTEIDAKIVSGTYNLELPSSNDEQGFPALDYLLNGADDSVILAAFTTDANAANRKEYIKAIVDRMVNLTNQVVVDWNDTFRNSFVNNTENTSTGSVNRMVNTYILYFEKFLREGKIAIPSGARTGTSLPDRVEAFYKEDISKELFEVAFQASKDFFNGKHANSTATGESLASYLTFVNSISGGDNIGTEINTKFAAVDQRIAGLNANFVTQINSDRTPLLQTFDDLQRVVVIFKSDMVSALNINIIFQDSDGD